MTADASGAGLVLAAGEGRRFGTPKALVRDGETGFVAFPMKRLIASFGSSE